MKNDDVKKLISSVRNQTDQLKRTANENLTINSRQGMDRSPALKTSKSNNTLVPKSPIDQKHDNSLSSYSNNKTNKNKLAELLNYKSDLNFAGMAVDAVKLGSGSSNNPRKISSSNYMDDENFYNGDQNAKSASYRPSYSTSEIDQRDVKSALIQQNKTHTSKKMNHAESYQNPNFGALQEENDALRGTIQDYKHALEFLAKKHKELKTVLNDVSLKDEQINQLQRELNQERQRNKFLRHRNATLRDKFINFVDKVRKSSHEEEDNYHEEDVFFNEITVQNAKLRQILQISKISDPEFNALEQLIQTQEKEDPSINGSGQSAKSSNETHDYHEPHSFAKWRLQHYHINTSKREDASSSLDAAQDGVDTKELIENFKKERMEQISSKKSFSMDGGDLTVVNVNQRLEIPVGADNTPILNRHNNNNTSYSSDGSQEGNHITFVSRSASTSSLNSNTSATAAPLMFSNLFKSVLKPNTEQ